MTLVLQTASAPEPCATHLLNEHGRQLELAHAVAQQSLRSRQGWEVRRAMHQAPTGRSSVLQTGLPISNTTHGQVAAGRERQERQTY